jgi:hypothetical protein
MHRDWQRSRPLLYTLEYTAQHSDGSEMHMRHCVRASASLGLGMRQRQRCWERSAHLGVLQRCGRYSESMRMKGKEETKELGKETLLE